MNKIKGSSSQNFQEIKSSFNEDLIILEEIKKVIKEEISTLDLLLKNIPYEVVALINKVLSNSNHIVFSGIGKSGIIAKKLSSTFSSLNIPSFFIHPIEALHGDFGMIKPENLILVFSKSGSGDEISHLIKILKANKNFVILITCENGNLKNLVDLTIKIPFNSEAGDLKLAPTSSSTSMLVFGDAIALTISKIKGLTKNDFAKVHPAGSLGKNLILTVESLMHTKNDLALIYPEMTFKEIIIKITEKKLGIGIVVDPNDNLLGVITDGDLRRACGEGELIFQKKANEIMSKNPKKINPDSLACEALKIMENPEKKTTNLVVTNENKVIGLIHIHDLIRAGISL